jgi:hypothetical protein
MGAVFGFEGLQDDFAFSHVSLAHESVGVEVKIVRRRQNSSSSSRQVDKEIRMTQKIRVMLQRSLTMFAALLCFGIALGAQAQELKPYDYPSEGFRVSFPSAPELATKSVDTAVGKIEVHMYSVELANAALVVAVNDYGSNATGKDPDVVLDAARQGALSNTGCHQISSKTILLDGHHGVEFEGENQAAHLTVRLYLVGSVLYQVMVITPLGNTYPDSTRFFDSFKLVPRVRG